MYIKFKYELFNIVKTLVILSIIENYFFSFFKNLIFIIYCILVFLKPHIFFNNNFATDYINNEEIFFLLF